MFRSRGKNKETSLNLLAALAWAAESTDQETSFRQVFRCSTLCSCSPKLEGTRLEFRSFFLAHELFAFRVAGLFWRHRWLQYFTSSQTFFHFFRQENDRLHATQIFTGRFSF